MSSWQAHRQLSLGSDQHNIGGEHASKKIDNRNSQAYTL